MPLLMGTTLFFAALLMVMNLLVDLSYAAVDPRVRTDLGLAAEGPRRKDDVGDGTAHEEDGGHVRSERSEEHTSELQSRGHLVCRLLLEKKESRAGNTIRD